MLKWQEYEHGSKEVLNFGFFMVSVYYRCGTKEKPIPDKERYAFAINGHVSIAKFADMADAKKAAVAALKKKLTTAMSLLETIED